MTEKWKRKKSRIGRESTKAEIISLNNEAFSFVIAVRVGVYCVRTSTPENALSGNRRMELCEKSKLRNGNCVVAYAYNRRRDRN